MYHIDEITLSPAGRFEWELQFFDPAFVERVQATLHLNRLEALARKHVRRHKSVANCAIFDREFDQSGTVINASVGAGYSRYEHVRAISSSIHQLPHTDIMERISRDYYSMERLRKMLAANELNQSLGCEIVLMDYDPDTGLPTRIGLVDGADLSAYVPKISPHNRIKKYL